MSSRTALRSFAHETDPHAARFSQLTIVLKSETPRPSLETGDVVQSLRKPFLVHLQEVAVLVVPLDLGILDDHLSVFLLSDDLLIHVDVLERLNNVVGGTVWLQLDWELVVRYQGCWEKPQILMSRILT